MRRKPANKTAFFYLNPPRTALITHTSAFVSPCPSLYSLACHFLREVLWCRRLHLPQGLLHPLLSDVTKALGKFWEKLPDEGGPLGFKLSEVRGSFRPLGDVKGISMSASSSRRPRTRKGELQSSQGHWLKGAGQEEAELHEAPL